jgi:hypothetical protein
MASDNPTQVPELNQLLQGWVAAISGILEGDFVGAYLMGSYAPENELRSLDGLGNSWL